MNKLPLAINSVQTLDTAITEVVSYTLPDAFQGTLEIELTGENLADDTDGYFYRNTYVVSCEAGIATIQTEGIPEILDPLITGCTVTVDTDGAYAIRLRITPGAVETWSWVGKIIGLLHFRLPSGTIAYYDPAVASTCTPYQDFAYDGVELVVNGTFAADTDWTKGAGWTIPGGNVADAAGALNTALSPIVDILTIGQRFLTGFELFARSAGSVKVSAGTSLGTARSTLATFQESLLCAGNTTLAWTGTGFTGQIKTASCKRLSIVTQEDCLITNGKALVQSGAASTRPTYLNATAAAAQGITGACLQYDGVGQFFDTQWVPTDNFTVGGWFYFINITGSGALVGEIDTAATQRFFITQTTTVLVADCGPLASRVTHPTALTVGWHHIMAGRSGITLNLWLDGVVVTGALAVTPPALSLYIQARNRQGTGAEAWHAGYTGQILICNRLLTDADVRSHMYSTLRI